MGPRETILRLARGRYATLLEQWGSPDAAARRRNVDLVTSSHVPQYYFRPAAHWNIPYVNPHSPQNHCSSSLRRSAARPLHQPRAVNQATSALAFTHAARMAKSAALIILRVSRLIYVFSANL